MLALRGQVQDITVSPGLVTAWVQGSEVTPYEVRVTVKTLTDAEWKRVEDAFTDQALFLARLLAGEMPRDIEACFSACKLSLFPRSRREIDSDCTCSEWEAPPCKHASATYYAMAERFDEDPFLLFEWRGRSRESMFDALRARRQEDVTEEVALPSAMPGEAQGPEPLSHSMANYWRSNSGYSALRIHPKAAAVPQSILRQLGAVGVEARGADLHDVLAPAYVVMSRSAESRAYEEEKEGGG